MNKSIRILILGLVTILALSGFTSCNEEKDVEVKMNDEDVMVYYFERQNKYEEVELYEIVKYPTHGTVKVVPGTNRRRVCMFGGCSYVYSDVYKVLYTPTINYIGEDSIQLTVNDYDVNLNKTSMTTATININVIKSNITRSDHNNAPIAYDQNITIDYETETDFNITASDADNDTLTFVIESNTSNGTIVLIDESTGDVTYTPNQGYSGPDHFTFKVVDEFNASSNVADVNITVKSLCDMDPTAPGCPEDPCLINPTMTPGCPGYDPCLLDPTATGCPLDPCLLDPTATGCPLDPCILDLFSIECQNSIQV